MVSSVFSRLVIALKHILGVVYLQEYLGHEDGNMAIPGEERASSFCHSSLIYRRLLVCNTSAPQLPSRRLKQSTTRLPHFCLGRTPRFRLGKIHQSKPFVI